MAIDPTILNSLCANVGWKWCTKWMPAVSMNSHSTSSGQHIMQHLVPAAPSDLPSASTICGQVVDVTEGDDRGLSDNLTTATQPLTVRLWPITRPRPANANTTKPTPWRLNPVSLPISLPPIRLMPAWSGPKPLLPSSSITSPPSPRQMLTTTSLPAQRSVYMPWHPWTPRRPEPSVRSMRRPRPS